MLAQSTSQYYFVLQSLHKVLPSTTSYYEACTKYFPVILRTTKLAQSTSQSLSRLLRILEVIQKGLHCLKAGFAEDPARHFCLQAFQGKLSKLLHADHLLASPSGSTIARVAITEVVKGSTLQAKPRPFFCPPPVLSIRSWDVPRQLSPGSTVPGCGLSHLLTDPSSKAPGTNLNLYHSSLFVPPPNHFILGG